MKRRLERIEIPGEHEARLRTWAVVRAAFVSRERVTWPRRHGRTLVFAAAVVAVVAAAVTPPGRSVVNSVRDAVGREKVVGVRPAHRELVRLPAGGKLLLESPAGAYVVNENGTRRRLGPYRMASWSPHAKFVAAVKDFELHTLDPKGNGRWSLGRKQRIALPRWSFEGYRIAYLSEDTLRVSIGDGSRDWSLGAADPAVAPAWKPETHLVAWVGNDDRIRLGDADRRRIRWTAAAGPDGVRSLDWSDDGKRLLVLGHSSVAVLTAAGHEIRRVPTLGPSLAAAFQPGSHRFALAVGQIVLLVDGNTVHFPNRPLFMAPPRARDLAWSPDGRWLLVSWPAADQFVFIRMGAKPKLVAVSNIARQFDPSAVTPRFPRVDGWCCSS